MNTDKPDYSVGLANLRKALVAARREIFGPPYDDPEHEAALETRYTSKRLRHRIVTGEPLKR
jgi:hypothetical protein